MGTTLQNGVYLPNEGERNCYAGLKTNWEILDQKVADVTALQQAVAGALHREIVASLPTTDIDPNTIYMILSGTSATENVYNEFMYVNNAWELIGTSATDLTNYYTKAEVDGKLLLKANDSDVVHKSGNETVGGVKTFTGTNEILRSSGDHKLKITDTRVTPLDPTGSITSNITWQDSTGRLLGTVANVYDNSRNSIMQLYARSFNANDEYESHRLRIISNKGGNSYADVDVNFLPSADNRMSLGSSTFRWNGVYATNYYYGSNNIEFSTKFVTTDTNQIISGAKTFSDNLTIYNSDDTQTPKGLTIRNAQWSMGESGTTTTSSIRFLDKNSAIPASITASKGTSGQSFLRFSVRTKDSQNNTYAEEIYYNVDTSGSVSFRSWHDNSISLGTSANKWKDVQTKLINGLNPSSLGMPVAPSSTSYVDISSYITVLDNSAPNKFTPPSNGYITFHVKGSQVQFMHDYGLQAKWSVQSGSVNRGFVPVLGGVEIDIFVSATDIYKFWFIPCQGNV